MPRQHGVGAGVEAADNEVRVALDAEREERDASERRKARLDLRRAGGIEAHERGRDVLAARRTGGFVEIGGRAQPEARHHELSRQGRVGLFGQV
jgi:hypothetical protein